MKAAVNLAAKAFCRINPARQMPNKIAAARDTRQFEPVPIEAAGDGRKGTSNINDQLKENHQSGFLKSGLNLSEKL